MAIHFLSGKPRAGKTLYGFKLLVDELLYGSRVVITNLPIRAGELNSYLQRKYPDKNINLLERLIQLSDDETGVFWTVRPHCKINVLSEAEWRAGQRPDYSAAKDGGVFYVIDEVHNFFNARKWMETGRDVLFYLSQHGKLGDTVICITQHVGNVDKQFRSVTQDYTYLRNYGKEKMGVFKLPGVFVRKTYPQPATGQTAAMETGTFRLDVTGLAACYDTAQGVGIHGQRADKGEKKRGVSWLWAVILVPLALIAFYRVGPHVIARFISPYRPNAPLHTAPVSNTVPAVLPPSTALVPAVLPPSSAAVSNSAPVAASNTVPVVTGIVTMNHDVFITLSDGRCLSSGRGDIRAMNWDYVLLRDGSKAKVPVGRF